MSPRPPKLTEDTSQTAEEAPQSTEDAPQSTEDAPQSTEDAPQSTEDAPQSTEDAPQSAEGAPQSTEDAPPSAEDAPPPQWAADAPLSPHIYRWDLDKTYLQTDFDSVGALLRTAFQRAADKENVPGSAELLRLLRSESAGNALIYFLSGSPRQMRGVLSEKLRLDGIHFDGFILKDNLRNLLLGRFRAVRDQIGYKLPALLSARVDAPLGARETLFGDDAERDAFVYSFYGDLLARRVPAEMLQSVLDLAGVYPDSRAVIYEALEQLPVSDPVERILIHLDRKSPPLRFEAYGPRVVPIYNYFQAALVLYEDGHLSALAVARLAAALRAQYAFTLPMLVRSFQDCLRRGVLSVRAARRLAEQQGVLGTQPEILDAFAQQVAQLSLLPAPAAVDYASFMPDYPALMHREQQRHALEKARRKSWRRSR